ncbi:Cyclin-dependent protein kinase inhibitor SMR4 [Senna tora]|uniref:Cyclin-dependent protein kinase inhibitor SMR4 n=1 Tax=Senna tora TaxID=362788 RepID=A0A834WR86_9FABA|nr:Cyclin-dependent protein kinase inhibitor SMR4 [Senna tora]
MEAEEEGCRTPTHRGCRIPAEATVCPPAPKKKKQPLYMTERREAPKNKGYFESSQADLHLIFPSYTQNRRTSTSYF